MRGFMTLLLTCSVSMSALALCFMAITPLLSKRYAPKGRYYAWLILVIGLIIPFRPQFDDPIVKLLPTDTVMPVIQVGSRAGFPLVGGTQPTSPIPDPLLSAHFTFAWWQVAAAVWLVGMAVYLIYHLAKHRRFMRMTKRWSEKILDPEITAQFQCVKEELGLSREIVLSQCASVGTPMLAGLLRPQLLLPDTAFARDELRFILRHELVHYKRKDIWYKGLVLFASAVHWFNPVVRLIAREIDIQCELSCDAEVVKCTDAGTRLQYSEAIIGVVKYRSGMKTALSTNFYGGKKGMKQRIFSIMDTNRKKAGAAVLCGVLLFTMATGFAFAAPPEAQPPQEPGRGNVVLSPWISVSFDQPDTDLYAPYAAFGVIISADGSKLLYQGQPVRMFVDEKAQSQAFYLDESGRFDLLAVRNDAGEVTGLESMTAGQAQQYRDTFFADELSFQRFGISFSETGNEVYFNGQRVKWILDQIDGGVFAPFWGDDAGTVNLLVDRDASGQVSGLTGITDQRVQEYLEQARKYLNDAAAKDIATVNVSETDGTNKYEPYRPYGITYSAADDAVYFNGQRVKQLFDRDESGWFSTYWIDDAGTVNLQVLRDASGQITGIESISDEAAQDQHSAADAYNQDRLEGLEARVARRIQDR